MKKTVLFLACCLALTPLFSQNEIGLIAGGSLFKGDVNRKFAFRESKFATGVFYRKYLTQYISFRASFLYTAVSGSDARNEDFTPQEINGKFRNLHFRSRILELNLLAEFYLRSLETHTTSPYFFIGGGAYYFNPQAIYQGAWHNLRPLQLEGVKYSSISVNGNIGAGWTFKITDKIKLAFEIGIRPTINDYIDDVSSTYGDKATLSQKSGIIAADLSDRSGELFGNEELAPYVAQQGGFVPDAYNTSGYRIKGYGANGDTRGSSRNKDMYLIYNFTITSRIGK